MSIYKHINRLNNNKWFYTILFLLYINVNYSQDSIYKEFFFNSGEISSKGYLINNLPGGKWVSYYSNSKIRSIGYWKNALLDSSWVFYDSSGKITLEENYKENLKNENTLSTGSDEISHDNIDYEHITKFIHFFTLNQEDNNNKELEIAIDLAKLILFISYDFKIILFVKFLKLFFEK